MKGFERVTQRFYCERELETEQNCNILNPHSIGHNRVSFPFSWAVQPGGWEPSLSGTCSSIQNLLSNWMNFLCTELYNSSTSTQSLPITGQRNMQLQPSLEWHVWSSSSGNNCHAVHRSLSFGASLCDGTMGFLPCPILSVKLYFTVALLHLKTDLLS